MTAFARTDRSLLGQWWWTVDRVLLVGVAALALVGIVMVFASSPPVARRLDLAPYHFVGKHLLLLVPASVALLFVSLTAARGVLRLGWLMLAVFGMMTILTLLFGPETKGATRWLSIGGWQLQPSEFLKPALTIVSSYLLSRRADLGGAPQACVLTAVVVTLLLLQPDIGMAITVCGVFCIQLFLAGLGWLWIVVVAALSVLGVLLAYQWFPHVQIRIDAFFDPSAEVYQVEKALRAVASGGLFGRGPGEGIVKFRLPEAHSDFVFAAAAEEFGIIAGLLIVAIFATLVLRALYRTQLVESRFIQLAAAGLTAHLGLQALINIAVNLNLVPTKGITLPLISYGGSSLLAVSVSLGMLLALTRRGARLTPLERGRFR